MTYDWKCILLYSLLNKKLRSNFYSQIYFFHNIFKFSVKLKIKVICNTFAAPRECKTFADHFDFQFDGKFRQIDAKITQMQKNFCQFGISYLVNSKAILLRDRQLGGIWFLLTLGSQFSSLGASPLGMKITPAG